MRKFSLNKFEFISTSIISTKAQHGFRFAHSCETALHEIISEVLGKLDEKLIILLLFIDFIKAFDLIDSELLIVKLIKYGFSNTAINYLRNYFSNRFQAVRMGNFTSSKAEISHGVPQGSILGPLLFIIYINDLPAFLNDFFTRLFADDTTLAQAGSNIESLMATFNVCSEKLLEWFKYNCLYINCSKTNVMVVTNKRNVHDRLPQKFRFDNKEISIVNDFKLLGVAI